MMNIHSVICYLMNGTGVMSLVGYLLVIVIIVGVRKSRGLVLPARIERIHHDLLRALDLCPTEGAALSLRVLHTDR